MAVQALVMGFGGTGAHVLTALKELTVLKQGKVPESIKFLLFDTIADWQPGISVQIVGGGAEEKTAKSEDEAANLDSKSEYFQLDDFAPDLRTHVYGYLSPAGDPQEYPHLKDWLHAGWLSENVPQSQLAIRIGAAQQRQIGRYAMFKNAAKIVAHIRPLMLKLSDLARGSEVNVWLIGSSAGGTGAGCLIDAAYLTRLAARDDITLKVTGVIVLPNVYRNVPGISQGRAYSLLRELERVQEQGIPVEDHYVDLIKRDRGVSSRVVYDKNSQLTALVESKLFDDLFYLGTDCPDDDSRRVFFTSVAAAIDPYLDTSSGPTLLEKAVNSTAAASSFGAARIYVPTETLKQIFAWEQVAEYLRSTAAPREVGDRVVQLYFGSEQDRANSATEKFRGLLELFKQLLDLESKPDRAKESFTQHELDARRIVTLWYELTGSNRTPEEKTVLLTYVEPCFSMVESERPRESKEWDTKTFRENSADPKGIKETQENSRDRFANKLDEVRKRYTNVNGGEHTFEKGRRHVLQTVSKRLQKKVDDLFIEELDRRRTEFTPSTNAPDQGTVLTQLFAEVTWMLGDNGPLRKVDRVIGQFIGAVSKEQSERDNHYTKALQALRESKKSGIFDFGAWVESYQQAARDECTDYLRWYQKNELLKDMQLLVRSVEQRLREWERLLGDVFDALVRREGRKEGEASALFTVTQLYLKGTLEKRLSRAARNRSAVISVGQPDPEMHGYKDELRRQSAAGLAIELLNKSYWEASLTPEGTPTIALVIDSFDLAKRRHQTSDIRGLPQELYHYFYERISEPLNNTDVFDYLIWLSEHRNISTETVVRLLSDQATTLINAGGVPETCILVYSEPAGSHKEALADSIAHRLEMLEGVERAYSDRNAITLIKVKKPSLDQIRDIAICRDDYFALRADRVNDHEAHDKELRRAQVFHPFRQELEAWYIERSHLMKVGDANLPPLPPRIARLLEDPEMMQTFVHSIATGVVQPTPQGWLWHGPTEDILLTREDDKNADVIKAAVAFVLRRGEGKRGGLKEISRTVARQQINLAAQSNGGARDEMVAKFVKDRLNDFIDEHAPAHLRASLKIVFAFYCDPKTSTALQYRVALP